MTDRPRDCSLKCPMYQLSERGCVKSGEVEKIEAGERCLYQDFDISAYLSERIRLWALGVADGMDGRDID